jgi:hypothetical protein
MKKYLTLALTLAALLLGAVWPLPAMANPGLRVVGAKLDITVSPGEAITHRMNVGLGKDDSPMDIGVEVRDLGTYSAKNFITIDNPSFHLEPGQSRDVTATINIPADVGDGGRYAIIGIAQKPAPGVAIQSLVAIDVPILLTIKDSHLVHSGKIKEITCDEVVSTQPTVISITIENTGNHHYRVKAELTISNASQKVLDTIYIPLTPSSIKPSMSSQLQGTFTPKSRLPAGVYTVKSRVMLEDDTLLDEASGSFELKEPYGPPAAINWPVIGGAIAAIIVVGSLIFFFVRRRAS